MHGPRFPSRLYLNLDISNPLAAISVYEKLAWDEEARFWGVPCSYLSRVESVILDISLSPNHELLQYDPFDTVNMPLRQDVDQQETVEEWMVSQLEWVRFKLLGEAGALKEVKVRFTVGRVSELEAFEGVLGVWDDWDVLKRVEGAYEWRHGLRVWIGCDHRYSEDLLRRVVAERQGNKWVIAKGFGNS